jgi:hypothetical protein
MVTTRWIAIPTDDDQPFEELIAAAGIRGFEAPALIRGDNILVDGIRLPFTNVTNPPVPSSLASIAGATYHTGACVRVCSTSDWRHRR